MPTAVDARTRIVESAVRLLEEGGLPAVTTRAVAAEAGVQSPAIYRLFSDMQGLLDAVAVHGFEDYLSGKPQPSATEDPVDALRAGWDAHVQFGLQHPELYRLMYMPGTAGHVSDAVKIAFDRLLGITRRIARAGRLTVDTFTAADMMHSGCMGVTFTMLSTSPEHRDTHLPVRMRELVISAVSDGKAAPEPVTAAHLASSLNEHLDETQVLSVGERALLTELLTRLARDSPGTGSPDRPAPGRVS